MEVRQVATKISYAVSRRSVAEIVGVRSPKGEGKEDRETAEVAKAALEGEKRELAVEGIVTVVVVVVGEEEWESLLEWPRVRSLLNRDAMVISYDY